MPLPQIVAIHSNRPQAGKSTLAQFLVKQLGYTAIKFADPMKLMLAGLFRGIGMDGQTIVRCLEGDLKETKLQGFPWSPRELMVSLGTDWGRRTMAEDFWCRCLANKLHWLLHNGCRVVIDDMRFPNEYDCLRLAQAHMVKVKRGEDAKGVCEGLLVGRKFDWVYHNEGSIGDYEAAIGNHFGMMMQEEEQGIVPHGSEG